MTDAEKSTEMCSVYVSLKRNKERQTTLTAAPRLCAVLACLTARHKYSAAPRVLSVSCLSLAWLSNKGNTKQRCEYAKMTTVNWQSLCFYPRPSLLPLLLHSPPHLAPLLLQLNLDVHEFAPQLLVGDLHRINHHLRFLRLPSLLKGWGRRGCGWWHSTLAARSGRTQSARCGRKRRRESVAAPPPCEHRHVVVKPTSWEFLLEKDRQREEWRMGKGWVSVENWVTRHYSAQYFGSKPHDVHQPGENSLFLGLTFTLSSVGLFSLTHTHTPGRFIIILF